MKNTNLLTNAEVLTQYTTNWCRQYGIKPRDLGCGSVMQADGTYKTNLNPHPVIDDVMILIKLREEFWCYWNHNEKCVWAAYWSYTYHKGFPFKKKSLKKIELLAKSGIYKQQQQELKRNLIKQQREHTTK